MDERLDPSANTAFSPRKTPAYVRPHQPIIHPNAASSTLRTCASKATLRRTRACFGKPSRDPCSFQAHLFCTLPCVQMPSLVVAHLAAFTFSRRPQCLCVHHYPIAAIHHPRRAHGDRLRVTTSLQLAPHVFSPGLTVRTYTGPPTSAPAPKCIHPLHTSIHFGIGRAV